MKHRARRWLLMSMLATTISPFSGLAGCDGSRQTAGRPKTYVYVVDWSASTEPERRRLLGPAAAEIEERPPGTRVVGYRMGAKTEEYFEGVIRPGRADEVVAALAKYVSESDPSKGTDYSEMAKALAGFSKRFTGSQYVVRVLTDGGDDYANDSRAGAEYRRAAAALCADQRLSDIAFYGPAAGTREAIRAAFARAGSRLRILDPGQELGP